VARSRRENERLTLSIARGNDHWLHLADWPGPHVVVRTPNGEISEGALLDAAHLAVHFSKLRGAEQADVIYTQCKNVRRLKGGGRGRVSHAGTKTLRVRMSADRLERLLTPPGAGAADHGH
jgi:predicted ribosome quality control (RQC) complex YloA/Tae2 family protein